MPLDSPSAKTGFILLDLMTMWDEVEETMDENVFDMLVRELNEAGAITATMDESAPEAGLDLDITPLLSGVGGLLHLTIGLLAAQTGLDRLAIINTLRDGVRGANS